MLPSALRPKSVFVKRIVFDVEFPILTISSRSCNSKTPIRAGLSLEIGRAHVCTPVTFRNLVCRLLLEKKNKSDLAAAVGVFNPHGPAEGQVIHDIQRSDVSALDKVRRFFFNVTPTTEIYTLSYTLSLHDALPISATRRLRACSTSTDTRLASAQARVS